MVDFNCYIFRQQTEKHRDLSKKMLFRVPFALYILVTPSLIWHRVLQKPANPQFLKSYPVIYEICNFLTIFTTAGTIPPLNRTQSTLSPTPTQILVIFLIESNRFHEIFCMVFMLSLNNTDQRVPESNTSHSFKTFPFYLYFLVLQNCKL